MTDTEMLENLKATLDKSLAATRRQTDTIMQLSKVVHRYEDKFSDLEARLLVLENRLNQ